MTTYRIKDKDRFAEISNQIAKFRGGEFVLVGISKQSIRTVFILQLIDSIRRITYLEILSDRSKSKMLYTPNSGSFNPLAGAVALYKQGKTDDAYWLVYLATHFGKHKTDRWNLTEDFYDRFKQDGVWDWETASENPQGISEWLEKMYPEVTSSGRSRRFGNHRKFETLKPGTKGTGYAVATYINWILRYGSHDALIKEGQASVGQNPESLYAFLYKELNCVSKLGRLGKFDFLCSLSNLQFAPIFPDKAYISESTGPIEGAQLLFGKLLSKSELEDACIKLSRHLRVSPQVIEDALCNWQKSPEKYRWFRG